MINENDSRDASVNEVAERIAGMVRIAEHQASEKGQSIEGINVAKATIVPILADFKRAIELNACGKVVAIEEAASNLVKRLQFIHDDPSYQGVWTLAQIHSGPYEGPQYVDELAALELALGQAQPDKPTERDEAKGEV